jgi:hypothetical protein
MWARIVNTFLGLLIMVSPSVLHFEKTAANNNYIVGPLVITVAVIAMWEFNQNARYFNVVTGGWLVIAPFILSFSTAALTTDLTIGLLVIVFSFVKVIVNKRYGGGWRSLFQDKPLHIEE